MKALTLITTEAGKLDAIAKAVRNIKNGIKEVLIVTGRADIAVFSEGSIKDIRNTIVKIGKIRNVVTTETMVEIE
jgi:recombinational DNA repair protein (RecF pathway)